ncbi:MAG TPA: T9SS type A sorting domain-containing protein, partial [Candidatus Kryptobacter bacterium]|nr:T9SS type A sorting domain-containing protein [Candidatus Kryptobacter bacterium]
TTSVDAFAVNGSNIFAGTFLQGVFLSTDNGTSWTTVNNGLTDTHVQALAVSGSNIFAGTSGGVFLSTNNGTSWTAASNGLGSFPWVDAFAVSGTNLFAGSYFNGVFLSTDNGSSWSRVNSGLTDTTVTALAVNDSNIFASTSGSSENAGVWRRPLSEMITAVTESHVSSPANFSLGQNYPNPFNPTTVISYQLSAVSHVTLKVYDVLGREVGTLVNQKEGAGTYSVTFDGSRLPSGVYFYRITAGNFVDIKKLVLLK